MLRGLKWIRERRGDRKVGKSQNSITVYFEYNTFGLIESRRDIRVELKALKNYQVIKEGLDSVDPKTQIRMFE